MSPLENRVSKRYTIPYREPQHHAAKPRTILPIRQEPRSDIGSSLLLPIVGMGAINFLDEEQSRITKAKEDKGEAAEKTTSAFNRSTTCVKPGDT